MIAALLIYCLQLWFAFYIVNHSPILEEQREIWFPRLGYAVCYSISCAFCFTFWSTLALQFIFPGLEAFVLAAPPIVLFINLIFERLKNDNKTES